MRLPDESIKAVSVPMRLVEKLAPMVEMMPDIYRRLVKRDHLCPRGDLSAGASMLADIPESWPERTDDDGDPIIDDHGNPIWTLADVAALALALGVQVLERDYWDEEGDRFEEAYEADRERRACME